MIDAPAWRACFRFRQVGPKQLWSLADMLEFSGSNLVHAIGRLGATESLVIFDDATPSNRDGLCASLDRLHDQLKGLPVSDVLRARTLRMKELVTESDWEVIATLLTEFRIDLHAELAAHVFLCVPFEVKGMYSEPERWFGEEAALRFLDARRDMRDCVRCLALDQATASVFHAMRIAEHGLRDLAVRLQVQFSKPVELENWKNIIDQIEKAIRAQEHLQPSLTKSEDLKFYSTAASHFFYMKEAWRNHVSHTRTEYDMEEARRIVHHVRDMMAQLAMRP